MRVALAMVMAVMLSNGLFADQERKAARQEYYALLLVEARVADPHAVLEFEDFDKLVIDERGIRVRTLRERDKAARRQRREARKSGTEAPDRVRPSVETLGQQLEQLRSNSEGEQGIPVVLRLMRADDGSVRAALVEVMASMDAAHEEVARRTRKGSERGRRRGVRSGDGDD